MLEARSPFPIWFVFHICTSGRLVVIVLAEPSANVHEPDTAITRPTVIPEPEGHGPVPPLSVIFPPVEPAQTVSHSVTTALALMGVSLGGTWISEYEPE